MIDCALCGFGAPWKKATSFLVTRVDYFEAEQKLAKKYVGRRGVCDYTSRPHQHVEGRTSDGQLRSRVSQAYPASLARCLADLFVGGARAEAYNEEEFFSRPTLPVRQHCCFGPVTWVGISGAPLALDVQKRRTWMSATFA